MTVEPALGAEKDSLTQAGRPRVLVSLEMATLGNSGIPQEARLFFKALLKHSSLQVSGLLMENQGDRTRRLARGFRNKPDREVLDASQFFLGLGGIDPQLRGGRLTRLRERFERFSRSYVSSLSRYKTRAVPDELFTDTAWRLLFQRSLSSADRELIGAAALRYTNITFPDVVRSVFLPFAPRLRLDTRGFDAIVFQDARPLVVNPGTKKYIRYHDAIPLTDPDLIGDGRYTTNHFFLLKQAAADSFFVCNTEYTRSKLCDVFPHLEERSSVIPCPVDTNLAPITKTIAVNQVVRSRLSLKALGTVRDPEKLVSVILSRARLEQPWRYILSVCAIEPKKNVNGIVRAWERLLAGSDERIKLVIVGKSGWNTDEAFKAMRPHVISGDLIHVEDLPFVEVQALMLNAEALLFPSFVEGFGYPPVEAISAGLPSVVSDIPPHRETLGEAALFADPYDVQSIANALHRLVTAEGRAPLRAALVKSGKTRIERFSLERTSQAWEELIRRRA